MDWDTILDKIQTDLVKAETAQRLAQERVDELRAAHKGLLYALDNYAGSASTIPASFPAMERQPSIPPSAEATTRPQPMDLDLPFPPDASRTDILGWLLQQARRPMTTGEALATLLAAGRGDTAEQVRNSLTYLAKVKLARRVGRGLWETTDTGLPNHIETESPATSTGPSVLSDQPGKEVMPNGNPAHRDQGPSSGRWLDRGHDQGASVTR